MTNAHRLAVGLVTLVGTAMLAGCAASASPASTTDASAVASPSVAEAVAADQEACAAFADVSTIVANAHVDHQNGRMTEQEYSGWLRLATRELGRIPTRGAGAVSDAIETLQALAPAIPVGVTASTDIDTDEFRNGAELAAACQAVGNEMPIEMFTGG